MNNELKENKELVLFVNSKMRKQEYNGEWYYSIIGILSESKDESSYWRKLK